jgi:hypothetical protein
MRLHGGRILSWCLGWIGSWDAEAHVARFLAEQADKPKRARSYTHHYHGGAHCDAISQPRRVDVRYVCSTSMEEGQVTLTLEERATCEVGVGDWGGCGLKDAESGWYWVEAWG